MEWFVCTAQNIALKASDEGLAQSRCMLYYCAARFIAAHANPDLELLNDLKVSRPQQCMVRFLAVHARTNLELLVKMRVGSEAIARCSNPCQVPVHLAQGHDPLLTMHFPLCCRDAPV